MKIRNILIPILLLIVIAQFIQHFLLVREFKRLEFTFEEKPVQVYVPGLSAHVRLLGKSKKDLVRRAQWLSDRLDKCLEKLEAEKGLEPMPPITSKWKTFKMSDGGALQPYRPEPKPFYEPYECPNDLRLEDVNERPLQLLLCLLNLQQLSVNLAMYGLEPEIENYEIRLKRLEEHSDQ